MTSRPVSDVLCNTYGGVKSGLMLAIINYTSTSSFSFASAVDVVLVEVVAILNFDLAVFAASETSVVAKRIPEQKKKKAIYNFNNNYYVLYSFQK